MNTKRLECAWLLREAAWALKRYADRIEAAVVAIDPAKQAKTEAAAQTWAERARDRLEKFSAARRKYLEPSYRSVPFKIEGSDVRCGDLRDGHDVEFKYLEGAFHVTRIGNPWRAGKPPFDAGNVKILSSLNNGKRIREVHSSHWSAGFAYAWRPA